MNVYQPLKDTRRQVLDFVKGFEEEGTFYRYDDNQHLQACSWYFNTEGFVPVQFETQGHSFEFIFSPIEYLES